MYQIVTKLKTETDCYISDTFRNRGASTALYKGSIKDARWPPNTMSKRNLLLLIEQTRSAQVAREIACEIAAQGHCTLTGLRITESDWPVEVESDSTLAKSLVRAVHRDTGGTGEGEPDSAGENNELLISREICYQEKTLSGPKYALLSQEAERNDLTLIGREGNFEEQSANAKEVINLMLQYRPRPLLITPPERPVGDEVLVAYDGDVKSSRSVQLFVLLGLATGRKMRILCVERQRKVAQTKIDSIMSFLAQHDIEATPEIAETPASATEVLFDKIKELKPSMVVVGARGTDGWRQTIFGSTGHYLIRHCPVPLFTST